MIIVFISAHKKYVFDCFEVRPYSYLYKEKVEEKLNKTVLGLLAEIQRERNRYFIIDNRTHSERIALERIVKIEKVGKNVVFTLVVEYTEDGRPVFSSDCYIRGNLRETFSLLPQNEFAVLNQVIIHFFFVEKIESDIVYLKNGEQIHIPRGKVRQFKDKYIDYCSIAYY